MLPTLPFGTRIGDYEILAALGAGGMGAVYRARDTKLQREVAIKVLLPEVAGNPERLARFQREAQLLAALNHPNIAHVYGLEDGRVGQVGQVGQVGLSGPFLVLELVDGPTLADRIADGPLPLDEALAIAKQIAEALEAAHEQGIIHRDLKPANIKVRDDGTVKVLDFGLAKAMDRSGESGKSGGPGGHALSNSPTLTSPALMTGAGIILGTAAYMAPEQAKGRAVDKRADIWAFGVVLFEMLAGARPFYGDDMADVLGAVVRLDPEWSRLPPNTPPALRALLEGCLRKDPSKRVGDISTALFVLTSPADRSMLSSSTTSGVPVVSQAASPRRTVVFAVLALVIGAAGAWFAGRQAQEPRAISRVSLVLGDVEIAIPNPGGRPGRTDLVITPDGRTVIFRGRQGTTTKLFARALDQQAPTPIDGTDRGRVPFLSPDGTWLGFWADGKLKKVPVSGGSAITICDSPMDGVPDGVFGASWGAHDTIAFSDRSSILTVSASGGTPTPLATPDASKHERAYLLPSWLPDEKAILFTVSSATDLSTGSAVVAMNIATGERHTVVDGGADAHYTSTGHLLYMQLGALMAAPFDLSALQVRGTPVGLLNGVMQAVNADNATRESGAGQYGMAERGTLAYIAGGIRPDSQLTLVWVDRHGVETPVGEPPGPVVFPRVSPDGEWVAFTRSRPGMRAADIWVHDVRHGGTTRLTSGGADWSEVWAPDSGRLIYGHSEGTSYSLRAQSLDGTPSQPVAATGFTDVRPNPGEWSRQQNSLLLAILGRGLFELKLDGDHALKPILGGQASANQPALSPDGRWLAYVSNESGRDAVYVRSYPTLGQPARISGDDGTSPTWGPSGRELFFTQRVNPLAGVFSPVAMMTVEFDVVRGFSVGKPRELFVGPYQLSIPVRGYDVTPDGQRFVMLKNPDHEESPQTAIHLVLNWADELKRRVPAK